MIFLLFETSIIHKKEKECLINDRLQNFKPNQIETLYPNLYNYNYIFVNQFRLIKQTTNLALKYETYRSMEFSYHLIDMIHDR